MTLRIDGKNIKDLSLDEIGATLQQIASELSIRGNAPGVSRRDEVVTLWAFNELETVGQALRSRFHGKSPEEIIGKAKLSKPKDFNLTNE